MRIIGLDVGERRIGVAKADSMIRIATPVGFFNVDGGEWAMIERVARMNNTNVFVIGLPRSNEGNETKQSLYVRRFAKKLVEKIPDAKIRFQDESLTSVQAEERLKMRKKAYEKGDIDAEAATIILQDFIEHYKDGGGVTAAPRVPADRTTASAGIAAVKSAPRIATVPKVAVAPKVTPTPKPVSAPKPASAPVPAPASAPEPAPEPEPTPEPVATPAPEAPAEPVTEAPEITMPEPANVETKYTEAEDATADLIAEVTGENELAEEILAEAPTDENTMEVASEEPAKESNKEAVKSETESSTSPAEGVKNAVKATATQVKEGAEKIADSTKGFAKREGNKVALNAKKTEYRVKSLTKKIFIISPIVIVVILLGITAVLKIRDFVRWQREENNRRKEEEMGPALTVNFTVIPGENIFTVREKLINLQCHRDTENPDMTTACFTIEDVDDALNYNYGKSFIPNGSSVEGFLLGDTYNFYETATAKEIVGKFVDAMEKFITDNQLEEKYKAHGLGSVYDGVTLASVVQKESGKPDMPTVAQVFLTRISYGIPLGSDVTVTYALDVADPKREVYQDNQSALQIESCYNTRKYAGLPCGPISMPSKEALLAVGTPTDTDYLYFLTGDDGVMYYSHTEYEHNRNAYLHCRELCNVQL